MPEPQKYNQQMNIKFGYLEKIDIKPMVADCVDTWFNQTLCKVNSSVLRLGVFEGEYHLHKHDSDDEVFFVLEGEITLETENGAFQLQPFEGICVPKGTLHRPISPRRSVVLMIENEGIQPLGD